ncbi:MAG: hypothetical protein RR942_06460 [Romboutsia sp.]
MKINQVYEEFEMGDFIVVILKEDIEENGYLDEVNEDVNTIFLCDENNDLIEINVNDIKEIK